MIASKKLQLYVNDELWTLDVSDAEYQAAVTGSKYLISLNFYYNLKLQVFQKNSVNIYSIYSLRLRFLFLRACFIFRIVKLYLDNWIQSKYWFCKIAFTFCFEYKILFYSNRWRSYQIFGDSRKWKTKHSSEWRTSWWIKRSWNKRKRSPLSGLIKQFYYF